MSGKKATVNQSRDTGMAAVLILLLVMHFSGSIRVLPWAILALLLTMIWPALFRFPARLWFGLSHIMGTILSKILLSIVFFVVVSPIGLSRRLIGKDPMQTKRWKKNAETAFRTRDQSFDAQNLERPY